MGPAHTLRGLQMTFGKTNTTLCKMKDLISSCGGD
jgi:hypothetical protein